VLVLHCLMAPLTKLRSRTYEAPAHPNWESKLPNLDSHQMYAAYGPHPTLHIVRTTCPTMVLATQHPLKILLRNLAELNGSQVISPKFHFTWNSMFVPSHQCPTIAFTCHSSSAGTPKSCGPGCAQLGNKLSQFAICGLSRLA
jgi:hypothetical protein